MQNLIFGPIWQLKVPFLLGNSNGHAVLFKNLHQNLWPAPSSKAAQKRPPVAEKSPSDPKRAFLPIATSFRKVRSYGL